MRACKLLGGIALIATSSALARAAMRATGTAGESWDGGADFILGLIAAMPFALLSLSTFVLAVSLLRPPSDRGAWEPSRFHEV